MEATNGPEEAAGETNQIQADTNKSSAMTPTRGSSSKIKTWACKSCQTRKIKCNGAKPFCSTCLAHGRQCEYDPQGPKVRARVPGSRRDELARRRQKQTHHSIPTSGQGQTSRQPSILSTDSLSRDAEASTPLKGQTDRDYYSPGASDQPQEEFATDVHGQGRVDVRENFSLDKTGNVLIRGPTNTLYESSGKGTFDEHKVPDRYASAILTANAAMERQKEAGYKEILLARGEIEGVPAELALHLLDIHWSRHHLFQLSYRPAFYRDMISGGPYYSPLLFFALLAVSARYSEREEVGGGDHSVESGRAFYKKAKELLVDEMDKSSIPTATALLFMGNALVSAGQIDRGWLYTGMGLRMIINLGLHVDINQAPNTKKKRTLEEVEIRKRVFWGAFISEKLQSLYLGRPIFIHKRDVHVPKTFLDVYEEGETWRPVPDDGRLPVMPAMSVSSFTCHCVLSEICGDIIGGFYAVRSKIKSSARLQEQRDNIRSRLKEWIDDLPENLKFTPWSSEGQRIVPIHIIVLHTIYLSLVILLERPFVADGHLISTAAHMGSWVDCTIAAEKIAHLLKAYRDWYTFRRITYQLAYATYVASTILVRNAKNLTGRSASVQHLAICLKAFEEMKIAHPGTARMEAVIRSLMVRLGVNLEDYYEAVPVTQSAGSNSMLLPSPNFNTSPAAVENRNFDLDIIRQSFAMNSQMDAQIFADLEMQNLSESNANTQSTEAFGDYQVPGMGAAQDMGIDSTADYTDLDYGMYGEVLDNDLLFGVLAESWQ